MEELCSEYYASRPIISIPNTIGGNSNVLHCQGNLKLLKKQSIAIVGTRRPTEEGLENAVHIAKQVCLLGSSTVVGSGLAAGIDTAAHETALKFGSTIAFVPFSLTCPCYPSCNRGLFDRICREGLAISQFSSDETMQKWWFVMRSRLLVMHSACTVLIEDEEEGGGRKACDFALSIGKTVMIPRSFYHQIQNKWKRKLEGIPVSQLFGLDDVIAIRRQTVTQGELF